MKVEEKISEEKRYAGFSPPTIGHCNRDTAEIMIASYEMIVVCNVNQKGRGRVCGGGIGQSAILFKKSSVLLC